MFIGLLAVFTALCALFPIPAGGSRDLVLGAVSLFSMDRFTISNPLAAVFSSSPFNSLDQFDPVPAPTRTAVIGSLEVIFLTLNDILPYAPSAYAPLPGSSPSRVRSDGYRLSPEYGITALATPAPQSGGDLIDEAPANPEATVSTVSDYRLSAVSLCNDIGITIAHVVVKVYSSMRVALRIVIRSLGLDLLYSDIIDALSEVPSAVYRNTFSVKFHSPISDAQAIQSMFRIVPKNLRKLPRNPGSVFFSDESITGAMRHIPTLFMFGPIRVRAWADAICLLLASCTVVAILMARIPCTYIPEDGVTDSEAPTEIEQEDDGETPDDDATADESITVYYSSTSLIDTLPITDETMKPTAVLLRVDGCDKMALAPEEISIPEDDGEVFIDEDALIHDNDGVFTVSERILIQENDSGSTVETAKGSLDALPENTPYSEFLENRPKRSHGWTLDRTAFIPRSERIREVYFASLAEQEKEAVVKREAFLRARSMNVMHNDTANGNMKASESKDSCKATIASSSLVRLGEYLDDRVWAVPEDVRPRAYGVDKLTGPRLAKDDRKALAARIQFRERVDRIRGRDMNRSVKDEKKEEALDVEENVCVVPRDVPSRMHGNDYVTCPRLANDDRKALAARSQLRERADRPLGRVRSHSVNDKNKEEARDVEEILRVVPKDVQSRKYGGDYLTRPATDDRKALAARIQFRERFGRGIGKDNNYLVKAVEKEEARQSFDTKKAPTGDSFVSAMASHSLHDSLSIPSADAGDEAHCKKDETREDRIGSEVSPEKDAGDLGHAGANQSAKGMENKAALSRCDAAVVPANGTRKSRLVRFLTPRGNGITPNAMSSRLAEVSHDPVARASGDRTRSKERQLSAPAAPSKFLRFNSNGDFSISLNMPSYMEDVSSCGICRPDPTRADGGWREGLWVTCSGNCFQKMIFRDFSPDNWYYEDALEKGGIGRVSRIAGRGLAKDNERRVSRSCDMDVDSPMVACAGRDNGGNVTHLSAGVPVAETKIPAVATNVKSYDDKVDVLNGSVVLSDDKDLMHVADVISEQEVQDVRHRPSSVHAAAAEATESIVLALSVRSGYKNLLDETMPFDPSAASSASTGCDMQLFDVSECHVPEQDKVVVDDKALHDPTSTLQPSKRLDGECMEALPFDATEHLSKAVLPRRSLGRSTGEVYLETFNPQKTSTPLRKSRKSRRSTDTLARTMQTEMSSGRPAHSKPSARSTRENNESVSIYVLRVREIFAAFKPENEGSRSSGRPSGKHTPSLDRVKEEASEAETPPPVTPFDEARRVARRQTKEKSARPKETKLFVSPSVRTASRGFGNT